MSWQRSDAACTHVWIDQLEAALRAATPRLLLVVPLRLNSLGNGTQTVIMTLEVEAAVLRGFLTATEENTLRHSINSTAGEQRGVLQPLGCLGYLEEVEEESGLKVWVVLVVGCVCVK